MTTPATETPTMEESSSTITLAWPELEVLAEAETYPRSLDRVAVPAEVEELPEVEPPPQEIIDIVRESLEQVRNLIAEAQSSTNDADQNNVNNDVPKPILEPVMTGALDADTEIPRTSTELTVERVETASTSSTEACSNKDRKVHRFKPRSWLKQAKAHQKGKQETTKHLGETTIECISCFDDFPVKKLIVLPCSHHYCSPCFQQLITTALANEPQWPPKCCLTDIPLKTILSAISPERREQYKLKAAEYCVPPGDRWYCPNTDCAKFIQVSRLKGYMGSSRKCPHCSTAICIICRGRGHATGQDCPQDYGLDATLEFAEQEGWRRCHSCHTMVELTFGCRHITCKCGAQFCYTCGAAWRTCECTELDEANRKRRIQEAKEQRDRLAAEEERDLAAAIAAVEEAERREAEERERLERLIALEEERRRQQEEERAQKHRQAVLLSVHARHQTLKMALSQLNTFQQFNLNKRHSDSSSSHLIATQTALDTFNADSTRLMEMLDSSISSRLERMHASYAKAIERVKAEHDQQEDETFISLQVHLRGKSNRESRTELMMAKLHESQAGELKEMEDTFTQKRMRFLEKCRIEKQALETGLGVRKDMEAATAEDERKELLERVLAERAGTQELFTRRNRLLETWRTAAIERGEILGDKGKALPSLPTIRVEQEETMSLPGSWVEPLQLVEQPAEQAAENEYVRLANSNPFRRSRSHLGRDGGHGVIARKPLSITV